MKAKVLYSFSDYFVMINVIVKKIKNWKLVFNMILQKVMHAHQTAKRMRDATTSRAKFMRPA